MQLKILSENISNLKFLNEKEISTKHNFHKEMTIKEDCEKSFVQRIGLGEVWEFENRLPGTAAD